VISFRSIRQFASSKLITATVSNYNGFFGVTLGNYVSCIYTPAVKMPAAVKYVLAVPKLAVVIQKVQPAVIKVLEYAAFS
jgi:hypothetical protein